MPPPPASWPLTFWPCANFSLPIVPRPLCSRLRPDVRDRQTSDANYRLIRPTIGAGALSIVQMCQLSFSVVSNCKQRFVYWKLRSVRCTGALSLPEISCAGGRHNMLCPLQVDLWPFDLESGVRVTCDMAYSCANFSLGLSILDLGPMYATDRHQTDIDRQCGSSLNASALRGRAFKGYTTS